MKKLSILLVALLPGMALAEGNIALTGKVGTLGLGAELTTRLTETAQLRFGINGYSLDSSRTEDGVDYDSTFRLRSAGLIGDLFPIQDSVFRISLGLFYNDNRLDMTAKPNSAGFYDLGNGTYSAATIGTLKGQLTFNKSAPYLGVGWGAPFAKPGNWSFALDVGLLYQGSPKLKFESAACSANAACAADLAIEQENAERDLRSYRWYPVVSAGAVYRF
jgi:hypothetical protein